MRAAIPIGPAMNQPASFWTRHAASVFAVRTFAAAMLALWIALLLDMPRPYWAMASVYITSNQLTGATWSKAVYRMIGTLVGATATISLIPNLVDAPELLSLAVALWVGVCLYLSLIDGTPRSYAFMLAGYTVALLGFPILATPEMTFDIVSARVQEIMLGIFCASVVSMLVLPRNVTAAVLVKADAWLAGTRRLAIDVLTGRGGDQEHDGERIRLAAAASEIDELIRHSGYETTTSANTTRALRNLRQHALLLLPLLASLEDQRITLGSCTDAPASLAEIMTRAARWLADGARDAAEADALRAALEDIQPPLGVDAGWTAILVARFAVQLRHLVGILQDCRLLREAIADGRDPATLVLAIAPDPWEPAAPHRDHGLALWAAAATALSVAAACTFWIATGWTDGASAALFAALMGSFLAGLDEPLPAFGKFGGVILLVVAMTGVYTFGVLPRITTFEMLVAALAPAFLLFGWMAARPATARAGGWLAVFTSVQLALQSSYAGDFASFANSSVALVLGVAITAVTVGVVRLSGAAWIANRLVRSKWRTLAAVANGSTKRDRPAIASLMQHRLALLAARIAVVPAEARRDAANLRLLRTALCIIDVRQASRSLSRRATADIDGLFGRLASACKTRTGGRLSDELVERLDSAIASTLQERSSKNRNAALIGLAGVRAGLFPTATPYRPHMPEQGRMAA